MSGAASDVGEDRETLEVVVDEETYVQLEVAAAHHDESAEEAAATFLQEAGENTPPEIDYGLCGIGVSAVAFWVVGFAWLGNEQGVPLLSEAFVPSLGDLFPIVMILAGAVVAVSAVAMTVGLPSQPEIDRF